LRDNTARQAADNSSHQPSELLLLLPLLLLGLAHYHGSSRLAQLAVCASC